MGVSTGPQRDGKRNWGMVALVALLSIVLFGVGVLVGRGLAPESPVPDAARQLAEEEVGPRDVVNSVPVGYARSEAGAVAAATNYALLGASELVRDEETFIRAMETVASPEWVTEARRQAKNGYEFFAERYGADVDVSAAVLRYRVVSFSPDSAFVELWLVSVARGSEREAEAAWGMALMDLAWVDGDWRIAGTENRTGPTPIGLQPDPQPEQVRSVMEEFSEFRMAPQP